jgi:hypothetical protein
MLRYFHIHVTEAVANLTRLLKKAKARNASVEKRRLKTMKQVISFAEFVQKEGDFLFMWDA